MIYYNCIYLDTNFSFDLDYNRLIVLLDYFVYNLHILPIPLVEQCLNNYLLVHLNIYVLATVSATKGSPQR